MKSRTRIFFRSLNFWLCFFGSIVLLTAVVVEKAESAVPTYTVNKPPAHQHLSREARKLRGVPQAVLAHIRHDIDDPFDAMFTAKYDKENRDDIITGSAEEDQEKNPLAWSADEAGCLVFFGGFTERVCSNGGRNGFFEHFWCPDCIYAGVHYNGAMEDGIYNRGISVSFTSINSPDRGHYDSAYRLAEDLYANYFLPLALSRDFDEAYYWLGRVAHIVEDLEVPAHVHGVRHDVLGNRDWYEELFTRLPELLYRIHGEDYASLAYRVDALPNMERFDWNSVYPVSRIGHSPSDFFKLLWYTAQTTQYWAVRTDAISKRGNATYRDVNNVVHTFNPPLWAGEKIQPLMLPQQLTEAGLEQEAGALLVHALRAVAGLYILSGQDLGRYHLSEWSSGVLPDGDWTNIKHDFSVPANLAVARVVYQGSNPMSVREAVDRGLLEDTAYESYQGRWRTFYTDLSDWKFRPGVWYSIRARQPGVKIILRAVQDFPRTTKTFGPLP